MVCLVGIPIKSNFTSVRCIISALHPSYFQFLILAIVPEVHFSKLSHFKPIGGSLQPSTCCNCLVRKLLKLVECYVPNVFSSGTISLNVFRSPQTDLIIPLCSFTFKGFAV